MGQKLQTISGGYSLDQAQRILTEIRHLQSKMSHGEHEKNELVQVGLIYIIDVTKLSFVEERLEIIFFSKLISNFLNASIHEMCVKRL